MHRDSCLALVEQHESFDPEQILQFLIKFTGVAKKTPRERIILAVAEEVLDLCTRARAAVEALPAPARESAQGRDALAALDRAIAFSHVPDTVEKGADTSDIRASFPVQELEALAGVAAPELAAVLRAYVGKRQALEERVRFLMNGTTLDEVRKMDPIRDCELIHTWVSHAFRVEGRVLETVVTNRIAQSAAVSLFFRSTKEAERNAIGRFYDTFILLANFFEWGLDSKRGRAVAERMNQIHGRYYAPNAGMKYVLLQTAFTFLEGADRIGHRPLLDVERRGYLHAYVRLGRAMNIADISDDYDEMYRWFMDFNRANKETEAIKRETFEAITGASFADAGVPGLEEAMRVAFRVSMEENYLSALGYPAPTAEETQAVRSAFFTMGSLVEKLPYTPYIRSLQNNPARNVYHRPDVMGVNGRSPHMPVADAAKPNGGFPEHQKPIVTGADIAPMDLPVIPWSEIARHNTETSLWTVIDGEVYDLTGWAAMHPGGLPVLLKVAGKDGSRAFHAAKHSAATQVFRLNYRIGKAAPVEGAALKVVPAPAETAGRSGASSPPGT
ncbi:MAG TPA: cytochrome b5-like heme/steroid binding domain-containing protein [Myxococcaceae bacterium]